MDLYLIAYFQVYTVNQESRYLLVQGVPSVGAQHELVQLFALYGTVDEYRLLDEYPADEFTEVYWIKYSKLQAARYLASSFMCTKPWLTVI